MKPCKLPTILIIFRNPTSLLPTIIINLSSSSSYETLQTFPPSASVYQAHHLTKPCRLSHHHYQSIKL
jgi:hypothetical protein